MFALSNFDRANVKTVVCVCFSAGNKGKMGRTDFFALSKVDAAGFFAVFALFEYCTVLL